MASIDKEKVTKLVDVCNVSREEASRVLDACHMDLDMAINRFLSGAEETAWSEVSKKKKPVPPPRAAGQRHGRGRDPDRDRDRRDRDRRDDRPGARNDGHRGRSSRSNGHNNHSGRESHANGAHKPAAGEAATAHAGRAHDTQPPKWESSHGWGGEKVDYRSSVSEPSQSGTAPPFVARDPAVGASKPGGGVGDDLNWSDAQRVAGAGAHGGWSMPKGTGISPTTAEESTNSLQIVTSAELPVTDVPSKRTFNYAAAAAAGTSHEKRPVAAPKPAAAGPPHGADDGGARTDATPKIENGDGRKKRNRGGRKHRARADARGHQSSEAPAAGGALKETLNEDAATASTPSVDHGTRSPVADVSAAAAAPVVPTNAWAARAAAKEAKEKQQAEPVAPVMTSAAPVNPATGSSPRDMLMQFGSFNIGGMENVNWSAAKQETPAGDKNVPGLSASPAVGSAVAGVPVVPGAIGGMPATNNVSIGTTVPAAPVQAQTSSVSSDAMPRDPVAPSLMQSAALPIASGPIASGPIGNGSGIFPIPGMPPLPQHPYQYNPRMMPGYSPYENGSDLNTSHNLNLLYDPAALPGMPAGAAGGKYAGMPGLGDSTMLSGAPIGSSAKDMLGNVVGDNEKGSTGASGVLPGAMDGIPPAPGYLMPPHYNYPMYGFPPYGQPGMQPGMAPPGPGHFPPYPPAGQVTSQGGFGGYPSQNTNIGKFNGGGANGGRFGFDDAGANAPVVGGGANRSSGLDLYNRGGYAGMGDASKTSENAPGAYKGARASGPMQGGLAAGAPVPPAYGEYNGGINAAWNSRQNPPRGENGAGSGQGNGYPPAGAGYWQQQQNGPYY